MARLGRRPDGGPDTRETIQLLAASLELPMDPAAVLGDLAEHPDAAGEELVRRVLGLWEGDPEVRRRLVALMRTGISHDHAAALLRDLFGRTILRVLRSLVVDDRPELRAALAGSQVGGLILGRYLVGVPALADASVEELVAAIGPGVQRYLTGPIGT